MKQYRYRDYGRKSFLLGHETMDLDGRNRIVPRQYKNSYYSNALPIGHAVTQHNLEACNYSVNLANNADIPTLPRIHVDSAEVKR